MDTASKVVGYGLWLVFVFTGGAWLTTNAEALVRGLGG